MLTPSPASSGPATLAPTSLPARRPRQLARLPRYWLPLPATSKCSTALGCGLARPQSAPSPSPCLTPRPRLRGGSSLEPDLPGLGRPRLLLLRTGHLAWCARGPGPRPRLPSPASRLLTLTASGPARLDTLRTALQQSCGARGVAPTPTEHVIGAPPASPGLALALLPLWPPCGSGPGFCEVATLSLALPSQAAASRLALLVVGGEPA
jgi:hypothetical protein